MDLSLDRILDDDDDDIYIYIYMFKNVRFKITFTINKTNLIEFFIAFV